VPCKLASKRIGDLMNQLGGRGLPDVAFFHIQSLGIQVVIFKAFPSFVV
jgi:hypothetical protein